MRMSVQCGLVYVVPLLFLAVPAHSEGDRMQAILHEVGGHPEQIKSAMITYVARSESNVVRPGTPRNAPVSGVRNQLERIEWAFKGERAYYRETDVGKDGQSEETNPRLFVFTDNQQYEIRGANGEIVHLLARRSARATPMSLGYYADGKWIVEDLRTGRYQFSGEEHDAEFGKLYHVSGETRTGRQRQYWFAPERGYLAVKIMSAGSQQRGEMEAIHQCSNVVRRGEFWFPASGSLEFRAAGQGVSGKPVIRSEFKTESWSVNDVPDQLFAVEMKPGTKVVDVERNTESVVSEDGRLNVVARFGPPGDALALFRLLLVVSLALFLMLMLSKLLRRRLRQ